MPLAFAWGARLLLFAAGALVIFAVTLPTGAVSFPSPLDLDYILGINIAAARHLVFGRDIVFTYGPYGFVATQLGDAQLRGLALLASSVLGLGYSASLALLARPLRVVPLLAVLPAIRPDALLFSLPLPAIMLCLREARGPGLTRAGRAALLAALPAIALLPLIKISLFPVSLASLAAILILIRRHRLDAMLVATLAGLCLIVLWRIAGQPVSALPAYAVRSLPLITGYSEAMSVPGPWVPRLGCLALVALCPAMIGVRAGTRDGVASAGLVCAVFILSVVAYHEGFVREDAFHIAAAASALGLILVTLATALPRLPFALATLLGIGLLWPGRPVAALFYGNMVDSMVRIPGWLSGRDGPPPSGLVAALHARPLPWRPAGTADMYTDDQMPLFAAGLDWDPRPVFQSYAAYTPSLSRLNADHLEGARAPRNVFLWLEAIDGRLPALSDAASWPMLLSAYRVAGYDAPSDTAWLTRDPTRGRPTRSLVLRSEGVIGQAVHLPPDTQPVWVTLRLRPTLAGRILGLLMPDPALRIRFDMADGGRKDFRIIPEMAETPFLISPVISTTGDFLRAASHAAPAGGGAGAFTIQCAEGGAWAWKPRFQVAFFHIRDAPR